MSKAKIYFHDIGDYLTREQKLKTIADFGSVDGITKANGWQIIKPDKYNDWVNQRDESYYDFIEIGNKKDKDAKVLFENYSRGLETARDAWVYNFSIKELTKNMKNMLMFYQTQLKAIKKKSNIKDIKDYIDTNSTKISWSSSLIADLSRNYYEPFDKKNIANGLYRPFTKTSLYYSQFLNHRVGQMPNIFPDSSVENLVICVTGVGTPKEFSTIMTSVIPDIQLIANGQCFPLYLYELPESKSNTKTSLFESDDVPLKPNYGKYHRRDAITDEGLKHFQEYYLTPRPPLQHGEGEERSGGGEVISKQDIFYYIYGLLHSPDYCGKYADNLSKELPRIPLVKVAADFWHFVKAGKELGKLHVGYESAKKYPVKIQLPKNVEDKHYHVTKLSYGKIPGKSGHAGLDKTTIKYNPYITITDIPLEAQEYIVNGKSALDWVVERYCVSTDKDSGIVNDANLWATETENNPKYILEHIQRVITVSVETVKIVNSLPKLVVK